MNSEIVGMLVFLRKAIRPPPTTERAATMRKALQILNTWWELAVKSWKLLSLILNPVQPPCLPNKEYSKALFLTRAKCWEITFRHSSNHTLEWQSSTLTVIPSLHLFQSRTKRRLEKATARNQARGKKYCLKAWLSSCMAKITGSKSLKWMCRIYNSRITKQLNYQKMRKMKKELRRDRLQRRRNQTHITKMADSSIPNIGTLDMNKSLLRHKMVI